MKKRLVLPLILALGVVGGIVCAAVLLPALGINFTPLLNRSNALDLETQPGFAVQSFREGLDGPRFITFSPDGELFVAERGAGRIVVLSVTETGESGSFRVFAEGLNSPHSLVFHDGSWFVGVPDGVVRLTDLDGDGVSDEAFQVITQQTPGVHNTRTVLFLPDGRMVVALGSSCNVCAEADPFRAAITVYDGPGGGNPQLFASGLRNAVGLTLHPATGELWASNNGRDLMGDDLPPDEIHLIREGADYGWPYCHSGRIEDPDLGFPGACDAVEKPVVELQAHSAALGLVFYAGEMFPDGFAGDLFVAFHGSWNRSEPTGYKVVRIPFEGGEVSGPPEDFVWGWLSAAGLSGRPVGLAVGPDGALYVSDDTEGRIYRVTYER
jgi:glucose/arabinose dehydrogenase